MIKDKVIELGWQSEGYYCNRELFSLSKDSKFSIFEHNEWGILDPFSKDLNLIYCDLTDEELINYTSLVKTYDDIISNPKDHTLYSYQEATKDIYNFIKKLKEK